MSIQKAVVKIAKGKGNVELLKVEEPIPESNEVKIEVKAAGICGSDIHIYHDTMGIPLKTPVVMGHEFSGVIVDIGENVKELKRGDRVTSETAAKVCGVCGYCKSGDYNLCSSRLGIGCGVNGAFTKYIVVPQERVHKLPKNIDFMEAALIEPLACCVHAVIEKTKVSAGDIVTIIGPGTIGLLALQIAKTEGAVAIICGTYKDKKRLELAKNLGADITLDIEKENLQEIVQKITDKEGVDVVFECSGSESAINIGLEMIKRNGKYTQIGELGSLIQIDFDKITNKEVQLTGSYSQKWSSWRRAIKLLSEKKVKTKPLITDILPITKWGKGFKEHEEKSGIKTILTPVN